MRVREKLYGYISIKNNGVQSFVPEKRLLSLVEMAALIEDARRELTSDGLYEVTIYRYGPQSGRGNRPIAAPGFRFRTAIKDERLDNKQARYLLVAPFRQDEGFETCTAEAGSDTFTKLACLEEVVKCKIVTSLL